VNRIDVLPDDVLLEIFDLYMIIRPSWRQKTEIEAWQSLVHVCRRWRSLVLASSHRLNLQLLCSPSTPARDTLDVWPTLPLIVAGNIASSGTRMDNVVAALEQSNRVCRVDLKDLVGWQLQKVLAAMQVPFPELTELRLSSDGHGIVLHSAHRTFIERSITSTVSLYMSISTDYLDSSNLLAYRTRWRGSGRAERCR
jgi:hypothetical protein